MKIYLAARYSRRTELNVYAEILWSSGITIGDLRTRLYPQLADIMRENLRLYEAIKAR